MVHGMKFVEYVWTAVQDCCGGPGSAAQPTISSEKLISVWNSI